LTKPKKVAGTLGRKGDQKACVGIINVAVDLGG